MKLGVLINSVESISEIVHKCALPAQKAFALAVFVKKLDADIKSFHELRESKIKELGEEKDGNVSVKPENIEAFYAYVNELSEKEIETSVPEISVSDLGDSKIEAKHLVQLDWLIK